MSDVLIGAYCANVCWIALAGGWRLLCSLPGEPEGKAEAKRMVRLSPVWPYWAYVGLRKGQW